MKYKDMKEMDIKEWDGKNFLAFCTDDEDDEVDDCTLLFVGYKYGQWVSESGIAWKHVYPVEWKNKPKRMTNRQLARWIAQGNGEWRFEDGTMFGINFSYEAGSGNNTCRNIRVRHWDSEEWIEPTTDLLKGDN